MPVHPLITFARRSPLGRVLAALACLISVILIGALDYATGSGPSFAVFYVLVIVVFTVAAGTAVGLLAALVSATAWGVAEALIRDSQVSVGVDAWNGVVRFVVFGIVVLLVAALLRARDAARQSEARSRSFLATAAHQLRTPVAALGASVEALLLEGANPSQERLLSNVAAEAGRLGRLVASLLRTARLDQGEPLRPEPVDVVDVCEQELERARQLSTLECRLVVEVGFPRSVLLDLDATRESLANLLDNARRHASTFVEVRLSADRGWVVAEVRDDGPGLPGGAEELAFDRFVALDGQGGSGLGLPIARDLARHQGGELVYAHKAFILSLPLQRPDRGRPITGVQVRSSDLERSAG
jgi:signal transduction histidine kinase